MVQRQQEHDRALLLPVLAGLSERQGRVFLMFAAVIARHQGEAFQKLVDEDIALAAEALASTLETSVRGIVYERRAATLPADRLLTELKALVAEITKEGGSALERDAAISLRRIEGAARDAAKSEAGGIAFQQLLLRLLLPPGGAALTDHAQAPTAPASTLIIP